MGRKRTGTVHESAEELRRVLDDYRDSAFRPRLEFLLALKDQPDVKAEVLMGLVGHSERTIRRWWKAYREGGLAGLLEIPTPQPAVAEPAAPYDQSDAGPLLTFLTTLPLTASVSEWQAGVERALAGYLEGVDDVHVRHAAFPETAKSPSDSTSAETFDIFDGRQILGTITVFGAADLDVVEVQIDELRPFLGYLFSDICARVEASSIDSETPHNGLALPAALADLLSGREREVLFARLNGNSYSATAASLGISEETVRKCVKSIYRKTRASSVAEIFVRFFSTGGATTDWGQLSSTSG